ncbi:hypothetical protein [Fusobacterium varium]|uniref:hypothetical protein n=1 Tax=Fusobacterium varium TaxID=856 RepID=UPI00356A1CB0
MEKGKRIFIKRFGSYGDSKVEVELKEIPMELLLEEVNERLGNKLEVQGLALLVERMGLSLEIVERMYKDKKDCEERIKKERIEAKRG